MACYEIGVLSKSRFVEILGTFSWLVIKVCLHGSKTVLVHKRYIADETITFDKRLVNQFEP